MDNLRHDNDFADKQQKEDDSCLLNLELLEMEIKTWQEKYGASNSLSSSDQGQDNKDIDVGKKKIHVNLQKANDGALGNLGDNVTSIDLRRATISDNAMEHIAKLKNLEYLNMHFVDISDEGLKHLTKLSQLTELHLGPAPRITDEGLKYLGTISSLTTLHVGQTKITDAGLAHLIKLKGLTDLHIDGTAVTDAAIEQLRKMTQLESLHIYDTKITPAGMAKLKEYLPNCDILGPDQDN